MAFNERWQGVLNRPPPPPEGSLREGLQVHVHGLLAHGDGRRMGRMSLVPDAVGTDVEEFHARSAVITLSQRGDEGAVFGKVDRVGVIRFDARDTVDERNVAQRRHEIFTLPLSDYQPAGTQGKFLALAYTNDAKLRCMSSSERLLRAVQFNTISALRTRLVSERFIEWLTIPCQKDGMTPVEALKSGMWQEVAELADDAMPKGVENF